MSATFWSTDNKQALDIAKGLVADNPRTSKNGDVIRARKLLAADHRRARAIAEIGKTTGAMDAHAELDRLDAIVV